MAESLLLAAAAFFTVIVVGSVLVQVNDWLESRLGRAVHPQSRASASARSNRPAFVHPTCTVRSSRSL